jgi:chromosome segregation ATPase
MNTLLNRTSDLENEINRLALAKAELAAERDWIRDELSREKDQKQKWLDEERDQKQKWADDWQRVKAERDDLRKDVADLWRVIEAQTKTIEKQNDVITNLVRAIEEERNK